MRLVPLTPKRWVMTHNLIMRFLHNHSGGRITHRTLRWLKNANAYDLMEKGTRIESIIHKKHIIGVIAINNYGKKHACIAVHPRFRRRGIGERLLRNALDNLGTIYTSVAMDNIPSIRLCFTCGLVAYRLTRGVTKKPTLHFIGEKKLIKKDIELIEKMINIEEHNNQNNENNN